MPLDHTQLTAPAGSVSDPESPASQRSTWIRESVEGEGSTTSDPSEETKSLVPKDVIVSAVKVPPASSLIFSAVFWPSRTIQRFTFRNR
jgi:hypothetical protein